MQPEIAQATMSSESLVHCSHGADGVSLRFEDGSTFCIPSSAMHRSSALAEHFADPNGAQLTIQLSQQQLKCWLQLLEVLSSLGEAADASLASMPTERLLSFLQACRPISLLLICASVLIGSFWPGVVTLPCRAVLPCARTTQCAPT